MRGSRVREAVRKEDGSGGGGVVNGESVEEEEERWKGKVLLEQPWSRSAGTTWCRPGWA
jgi:hypothetical protein